MQARFTEVQWLDVHQEIPLPQLAELSGLSPAELRALADFGVFQPLDPAAAELHYRADYIVMARTACRLRDDLELNIEGLAMVLKLLERMHSLEAELQDLKARLPGHIGQG
jgi:chaperone modulatory protein CbpM